MSVFAQVTREVDVIHAEMEKIKLEIVDQIKADTALSKKERNMLITRLYAGEIPTVLN
ncbi:hypothetical protein [Phyllobacterium endophyticum]|uniref:hypothetical protein n=1 Tax=Phyllobacterium endophyticum TaxID=1149773 RepID=UPI00164FB39B|nr:hypothetical protein [Phyllobacterium endophyticum]